MGQNMQIISLHSTGRSFRCPPFWRDGYVYTARTNESGARKYEVVRVMMGFVSILNEFLVCLHLQFYLV